MRFDWKTGGCFIKTVGTNRIAGLMLLQIGNWKSFRDCITVLLITTGPRATPIGAFPLFRNGLARGPAQSIARADERAATKIDRAGFTVFSGAFSTATAFTALSATHCGFGLDLGSEIAFKISELRLRFLANQFWVGG